MIDDDGWPIDDAVMEWKLDGMEILRHPGTEFRDGEFKPVNHFGLFTPVGHVCDGTFEYVTNYYWAEFA